MFAGPILGATSPTGAGTRKTYPASTMRTLPRLLFPALTAFVGASLSAAPEPFVTTAPIVQIWPGVAPGSEGKTAPERWVEGSRPDAMHRVTDIHNPSLTIYLPAKAKSTGAAIVIAPGGGHRYLVVDKASLQSAIDAAKSASGIAG